MTKKCFFRKIENTKAFKLCPKNVSPTDYQCQQTARDLQHNRHRKSPREKEKCPKGGVSRRSFESNPNVSKYFDSINEF